VSGAIQLIQTYKKSPKDSFFATHLLSMNRWSKLWF